jgi:hypothetical protein
MRGSARINTLHVPGSSCALATGHGRATSVQDLSDTSSGKALTPGDCRSRCDLAGLQLAQPFESALQGIVPVRVIPRSGAFLASAKSTMTQDRMKRSATTAANGVLTSRNATSVRRAASAAGEMYAVAAKAASSRARECAAWFPQRPRIREQATLRRHRSRWHEPGSSHNAPGRARQTLRYARPRKLLPPRNLRPRYQEHCCRRSRERCATGLRRIAA